MSVPRQDLLDEKSLDDIEVSQLTLGDVPCSHVYMEAQIFTPDSKRFVLHRSAHAHGSDQHDTEHQYLVCDIENNCKLSPITTETGATAPSLSPDGSILYYFVNETEINGGRLTLKRVNLDGTCRETILVIDSALGDTKYRASRPYPLSTISADGKRLALSAFLGDGVEDSAPFGLMVFNLEGATAELILEGPTWCNIHPQYCRSKDPAALRDIMVQENHGNVADAAGVIRALVDNVGADIHLVRDDGEDFRNFPWGRDGNEACQGHQCWRGRSTKAITSTVTRDVDEKQFIESRAVPYAGHIGLKSPLGVRNDLTRTFSKPNFYHFATDIAGTRIVSDSGLSDGAWSIYLADLPSDDGEPCDNWRYLLNPRSSPLKETHPHSFLSPDGSMAFFNSDESGVLHAYMIRGL